MADAMIDVQPRQHNSLSIFGSFGLGLVLLAGLCAVMSGLARPASAAQTLTVTNCSTDAQLQGYITTANGESGDTINFSCSGTILLTNPLHIMANMTLDGSGQQVTLDGQNLNDAQLIVGQVTFTLNALTVANGGCGLISFPNGTTHITNCTFASNNGGICNEGTMTITDSTFSGNASGSGGAISTDGTSITSITSSTFTDNSAYGSGGAIYNGGTMTITNSTIANNMANLCGDRCNGGGGGISGGGSGMTTITDSTIVNNTAWPAHDRLYGGGIGSDGPVTIARTIVANNGINSNGGFAHFNCFGAMALNSPCE